MLNSLPNQGHPLVRGGPGNGPFPGFGGMGHLPVNNEQFPGMINQMNLMRRPGAIRHPANQFPPHGGDINNPAFHLQRMAGGFNNFGGFQPGANPLFGHQGLM